MNIIFDLDGTLVDSAPDIHAAANLVLADAGRPALDLPTVRGFIGEGTEMLTRRVIAASGADPGLLHDWHRAFLAHYEVEMVRRTRPYPGVPQALRRLQDSGARLGVCTNKPEGPARAILAAAGLMPLVSALAGGDTLAARKPSPAPLWHVARMLGEGPVVYVGDSEVDAAAAQAAGMPFLLFSGGYRKTPVADLPCAAHFDRFDALPDLAMATVALQAGPAG